MYIDDIMNSIIPILFPGEESMKSNRAYAKHGLINLKIFVVKKCRAYAINFIIKSYLVLLNNIKTFDMEEPILNPWEPNT